MNENFDFVRPPSTAVTSSQAHDVTVVSSTHNKEGDNLIFDERLVAVNYNPTFQRPPPPPTPSLVVNNDVMYTNNNNNNYDVIKPSQLNLISILGEGQSSSAAITSTTVGRGNTDENNEYQITNWFQPPQTPSFPTPSQTYTSLQNATSSPLNDDVTTTACLHRQQQVNMTSSVAPQWDWSYRHQHQQQGVGGFQTPLPAPATPQIIDASNYVSDYVTTPGSSYVTSQPFASATYCTTTRTRSKQHGGGRKKPRYPAKGTNEYVEHRRKNNEAVRRSRAKQKLKQLQQSRELENLKRENDFYRCQLSFEQQQHQQQQRNQQF